MSTKTNPPRYTAEELRRARELFEAMNPAYFNPAPRKPATKTVTVVANSYCFEMEVR